MIAEFEYWFSLKPIALRKPGSKAKAFRFWVACYFKCQQQRKLKEYMYA